MVFFISNDDSVGGRWALTKNRWILIPSHLTWKFYYSYWQKVEIMFCNFQPRAAAPPQTISPRKKYSYRNVWGTFLNSIHLNPFWQSIYTRVGWLIFLKSESTFACLSPPPTLLHLLVFLSTHSHYLLKKCKFFSSRFFCIISPYNVTHPHTHFNSGDNDCAQRR